MRIDGTLKTWNAERGFGFIAPRQGGQDIFVHISAFPRDGRTPCQGESLSFEVEATPEGKQRAAHVQRPGASPTAAPHPSRRGSNLSTTVLGLALVGALAWYGYGEFQSQAAARAHVKAPATVSVPVAPAVGNFRCDGRIYCSQMTSCTEAKFFLQNCPGTKMDGNNDGVPCEQQWCTSPTAR